MRKLRIAFDASQTGRRKAGCGFYAAALLDGLLRGSRDAYDYTVLTSFGSFFHDPCQALAFPHWARGCGYGPRFLSRRAATLFWNNRARGGQYLDQFDIVHANNFWCPPWSISGCLVYTLYDMSFLDNPEWTTDKNRSGCLEGVQRAARFADRFVAISEATKSAFLNHFPDVSPDKITVVYPASRYSMPGYSRKPRKPKKMPARVHSNFFLSVGTIEPRKNQEFLVTAYENYRERGNPPIPLVFAGKQGWLMDGFQARIKSSKWADDIHMLGYVSERELAWLYSNCLANLYPSLYEGFGLPVLEGMSFGAYTLAANVTSIPEIAGTAGILLPPNDTEAWIRALANITTEPSEMRELRSFALAQSSTFAWAESTKDIFALYEKNK
jgi:glycosyltransferase involved in cell wall biosynthesis